MKKVLTFTLILAMVFFIQGNMDAQCAMCKVAAENADEETGNGLNSAITYMIGIPYLLLITGIFIFWRKKILAFFRS
ncbi:MAG: hypothetical protein SH856_07205 [Flavobacteriales bacterium]|nr:hypothetical protein [Flavobacteriales bacterium]